jgi:hypothetical protein
LIIGACAALGLAASSVRAESSPQEYLKEASALYDQGMYFKSARYAFAAMEEDPSVKPSSYSWISMSLVKAGLPNSASYFFIKTLQTDDRAAIRRVLVNTQELLVRLGADVFRRYLIAHTHFDDYDANNRSAYLYALGKDAVLGGEEEKAVGYLNGIRQASPLWGFALELRGTAKAILNKNDDAIDDFNACVDHAYDLVDAAPGDSPRIRQLKREAEDLQARCHAGHARVLYQMNRFEEADIEYDRIPKASLVWPDILFEQAWNSFGRMEYNRSLGKLVSYKSPALSFVFNTEVEVLRAQSFLALCLYTDANETINEFNTKYTKVGEEVKRFVENNASNLDAFYEFGKKALGTSLYTPNDSYRMADRFVRGPYFQNLVASERDVSNERSAIKHFDATQPGVEHRGGGFPGFLKEVLDWRGHSIRELGGAYVKNSLMDYHSALISDFEKMAFIKLEMLKRAKDAIVYKNRPGGDRDRGNMEPHRRDDQMFWSFNGEFWNDELGDYIFGLESECKGNEGG